MDAHPGGVDQLLRVERPLVRPARAEHGETAVVQTGHDHVALEKRRLERRGLSNEAFRAYPRDRCPLRRPS